MGEGPVMRGKTVLVTGGASGIGRATSERLIELGSTVTIGDVSPRGRSVAGEIGAAFVELDVTQRHAYDAAFSQIIRDHGRLHLLHLNAGVMAPPVGADIGKDGFAWVSDELYGKVTAVNVEGVIHGIMAARALPTEQRPEDIVITASLAGLLPLQIDPLYSMSKHAVVGFARSVAPLLAGEGVRLQIICPGGIETDINPPDLKAGREWAPPRYIADAVVHALRNGSAGDVWLATDSNRPYTRHEFAKVERGQPESDVWKATV
jgi:NAD(P)-dependent dehydrogenase (short-subunit alcohol dehydrogenase family)